MPDDDRIETLLRERTRFVALRHVASCPSTQDLAGERCDGGSPPPDAVFWADHQTSGRGRQRREWHDEPGLDLAVTFRVRAELPVPVRLPAALPVAVLQALEALANVPLRIKWPNDLFANGRKLCGVLVDRGGRGDDPYLIGIGVNVNRTRFPPDLEVLATSLALVTGREFDRGEVLLAIAERLDALLHALARGEVDAIAALFADRLGLLGRRIEVDATRSTSGVLTAIDLDRLQLDGRDVLPLAGVRALRPVGGNGR